MDTGSSFTFRDTMSHATARRFRFAPSPNGFLHLGHALSALFNAGMAERSGGRFLLRIEDIDAARSHPEFAAAILEDLGWLGPVWEQPVRRQSEHMETYQSLLDRLRSEELVYPAFLSRGEIRAHIAEAGEGRPWPHDPDGAPLYPGLDKALSTAERQRRMANGAPFAWRLDMDEALRRVAKPLFWREWISAAMTQTREIPADPAAWGDVMLARRGLPTSYHLSVVADDARQGITDVVRGLDLFQATAVHRLLQELLGLPQPAYFHHRLIMGPDGRKLSKSEGALALRVLRESGCSPADVRRMVGWDEVD